MGTVLTKEHFGLREERGWEEKMLLVFLLSDLRVDSSL